MPASVMSVAPKSFVVSMFASLKIMLRKSSERAVERIYMSASAVSTVHAVASFPTLLLCGAGSVTLIAYCENFLKKSAGRALTT